MSTQKTSGRVAGLGKYWDTETDTIMQSEGVCSGREPMAGTCKGQRGWQWIRRSTKGADTVFTNAYFSPSDKMAPVRVHSLGRAIDM